MSQQHPFKVIIIGSGLAGALLANGLGRHNIEYQVYERQEQHSKREGYQVRLGENALIGMRACLERDHLLSIVGQFGHALATPSDAPIVYDMHFNKLLDLSQIPSYAKSAPINRVTLRDLLAEPVEQSGRLHYEARFSRYVICHEEGVNGGPPSEYVKVLFEDGSSERCDLLIGADGNQSKINKQLGLDNIELLNSHAIFLTKCDLPVSTYKKLSPELLGSPVATYGHNVAFFFSVFLPERRDGEDETTFNHQLSNCMLGIILPKDILPDDLRSISNDEKWELTAKAFEKWSPKHKEVIDLLKGEYIYSFWPRVGHQPQPTWREDIPNRDNDPGLGHPRVWLMGDAVHPMLPTRGQGGNNAMRDAADALPRIVELATKHNGGGTVTKSDVKTACDTYELAMVPRAFSWVKKSGHNKPMIMDLARTLDRTLLTGVSYLLPLVKLGFYAWSYVSPIADLDDAPEFEHAGKALRSDGNGNGKI